MENVGSDGLYLVSLGFFLLSFAIASVAVVAGIGGGVLFTPIMLAFTPIDSLIVRGTGLVVAMFSGLISTGPFMKSGLGNLKLTMYCNVGYGSGAYFGAQGAVLANEWLGDSSDGLVKTILGVIVLLLAIYFIRGGSSIEWPRMRRVDRFSAWLALPQPYYEVSTQQLTEYQVTRAGLGIAAMAGVGVVSGFFGLGAGWAIVPALNLIMGVPLKVAAATSGILIGMGDSISVWPYIFAGAVIPFFVATWLVRQVLGGIVGAQLLIVVKTSKLRVILIGMLLFSSFGLLYKGLITMGYIPNVPDRVYIGVMLVFMAVITLSITGRIPIISGRRQ